MLVRGVERAIVALDPFIRLAGDLKRRAKIWRFDRLSDGWGNLGNLVSAHSSTVDVSTVRSWPTLAGLTAVAKGPEAVARPVPKRLLEARFRKVS